LAVPPWAGGGYPPRGPPGGGAVDSEPTPRQRAFLGAVRGPKGGGGLRRKLGGSTGYFYPGKKKPKS